MKTKNQFTRDIQMPQSRHYADCQLQSTIQGAKMFNSTSVHIQFAVRKGLITETRSMLCWHTIPTVANLHFHLSFTAHPDTKQMVPIPPPPRTSAPPPSKSYRSHFYFE